MWRQKHGVEHGQGTTKLIKQYATKRRLIVYHIYLDDEEGVCDMIMKDTISSGDEAGGVPISPMPPPPHNQTGGVGGNLFLPKK